MLSKPTVSKTIYSTAVGSDVFKYVKDALNPLEIEIGFAKNELVSVATRAAIDLAIVDLVKKGEKKEMWKFKENSTTTEPAIVPIKEVEKETIEDKVETNDLKE